MQRTTDPSLGNVAPPVGQSKLFQPLSLGHLTLANRILIAPMCQYSAQDGNANDWHLMHYGSLAASGAGLLVLEATAVSAIGRISDADLGLYSDENQLALGRLLSSVRRFSSMPVAIQIAHAGRKASSDVPWRGAAQIAPDASRGWMAEAPSAIPHAPGDVAPASMSQEDLARVREEFVATAQRADALGFDGIEIHMAHGYLLHEFLSPLSNGRDDEYGGALENRLRFPLEVFAAVRKAVSADKPVWVRISATDWAEGGWDIEGSVELVSRLGELGCAAAHVSSGGLSTAQQIPVQPGYQVGFAETIKQATGIPTIAVGLITEPNQAEHIVASGQADAVAIGRAALFNPRWPWHAAASLGAQVDAPKQYWRSQPREYRDLFRTEA
ncbi:NADH:flavin oxidoreductase/NADH oxidase [Comamonas sp. Tr-654]|uniref:NADH:flavin oxidoreductase/NADH oxidase n=1 Tax=Comamonas sp. Tr-654 TaxID=2608341 RepID=UPI00141E2E1A|nr:NADH:flavin oxidoreductase/NADH oxidase [Comamonas sp. Tr-654]NIF85788.1 NADH:flavin oxidoreductase/NADH oxidase [Comamonas sp. Tr-654]